MLYNVQDLSSWTRFEPGPSAVKVRTPNHWTAKKFSTSPLWNLHLGSTPSHLVSFLDSGTLVVHWKMSQDTQSSGLFVLSTPGGPKLYSLHSSLQSDHLFLSSVFSIFRSVSSQVQFLKNHFQMIFKLLVWPLITSHYAADKSKYSGDQKCWWSSRVLLKCSGILPFCRASTNFPNKEGCIPTLHFPGLSGLLKIYWHLASPLAQYPL